MKNILNLSFIIVGFFANYAQNNCEDAFSAANYSVAHATNAYEAYNATHVQEWTAKAMETFQEVEEITSNCGCDDVSNLAYEGYEASEKSQYQNTWERSRFYAKRAKEKATLMIEALAVCTNTDIFDIQNNDQQNPEFASNDNELKEEYFNNNDDIEAQKAELLAQQKLLEEQQAALALKIEEQKLAEEALKKERELIFEEQVTIKTNADNALEQISTGFQNLANALGCEAAFEMAKNSYELTKQQINEESISDTKLHYTLKLNEIAEKAMLNFADCSNKF